MTPGYLDGPHHEKRPDPTTPEASGRKPNTHHEGKKEI